MATFRKRWVGFIRGEATAEDLTKRASEYLADHVEDHPSQPAFLWVHYVEPHAPYRFQRDFAESLGLDPEHKPKPRDRYDTEIAFVDHHIGRLLEAIENLVAAENVLVVFVSDHGESLGEHDYWGHGRHLYEPTLWVPMGLRWTGKVSPATIDGAALSIDLAPTVLRLLDLDVPESFKGFDWSGVLDGADPPEFRITQYQAHKGAVRSKHESELARESGLLAVARIRAERKEIYRVDGKQHLIFDLPDDPGEAKDLAEGNHLPTESLMSWIVEIADGLRRTGDIPEPLDEESIEKLRALGYVD